MAMLGLVVGLLCLSSQRMQPKPGWDQDFGSSEVGEVDIHSVADVIRAPRNPEEVEEEQRALNDLKQLSDRRPPTASGLRNFLSGGADIPPPKVQTRQCSPTLFRVFETSAPDLTKVFRWQTLSADDVLNYVLLTLPLTQFAKVPETPFSNVDGRINHPVLGAMGGDAGEFILALNAFETVLDKPLTEFQVASMFSDYLLHVNKNQFLLQTDMMALTTLCRSIKFCLPNDRVDMPTMEMIPVLRKELLKADHLGCSHLKHIVQDPAGFHTRRELVMMFLTSYYNLLWGVPINTMAAPVKMLARSKLKLQVLNGPHTEGAVVHVNTTHCSERFVPMLLPEYGKVSVGISHVDAARQLRKATATFLNDQAKKMGFSHPEQTDGYFERELLFRMNDIADRQFDKAREMDGGMTPVYTLKYPPECCMGKPLPVGTEEPPPRRY